jgi:alcohol dehydrogenase
MNSFDHHPQTRIVFGPDKIDTLGELAVQLGAQRAMVVTDPGIVAAGHVGRGQAALQNAGLECFVYEGVHENPTTDDVEDCLVVTQTIEPDLIVGLGGGSSMDCAKAVNFLFTGGGRMEDYWGVGKASRTMLPMIAVPTTAGTGSETQSFALISDAETRVKMACGDKKAAFRIALLDPKLTITQPDVVTAVTGIDALSHALETYVTAPRNPVSLAFSREAWQLLAVHFPRVLKKPDDVDARGGMQLGACFAGLAIENSMLGAGHALANPLTARFGIVHGQAIALMLPHVIRYNGAEVGAWYNELIDIVPADGDFPARADGIEGLADFVTQLSTKAGLATHLSKVGVVPGDLPMLASEAAKQWTATFNPRKVTERELLGLYEAAY